MKNTLFSNLILFSFHLQGLPTCQLNLTQVRTRITEITSNCWGSDPPSSKEGEVPVNSTPNTTKLQSFYKAQQKKMPGFRGRRGLCGCFQVSLNFIILLQVMKLNISDKLSNTSQYSQLGTRFTADLFHCRSLSL